MQALTRLLLVISIRVVQYVAAVARTGSAIPLPRGRLPPWTHRTRHQHASGYRFRTLANISSTPHPAPAQPSGQTGGFLADINSDFGVSGTVEATRAWAEPMLEQGELPTIAIQNARATGTDVVSYLTEGFGFTVSAQESDTAYHCYSSEERAVEFPDGVLPDP